MANPTSRRVLADKNANANLNVNKHHKPTFTKQATLPQLPLPINRAGPSKSTLPDATSSCVGQKRKISEVSDPEDRDSDSQESNSTQQLSDVDMSGPVSELNDPDRGSTSQDSDRNMETVTNTSLPSFHASQAEIAPPEEEFSIVDEEVSQRALDILHTVSFPVPAGSAMSFLRPSLLKGNSNVSISMSSLIDFDQDQASQQETKHAAEGLPQQADDHANVGQVQSDELGLPTQPDTYPEQDNIKHDLTIAAATLKTRLQLALYKVQTNQAATPFSRLSPPHTYQTSRRPVSPEPQPYYSSPMSSPHAMRTTSRFINSPESRIAIARARATLQAKPPVRSLGSIAMPEIAPTAFSARFAEPELPRRKEERRGLSSPPDSQSTPNTMLIGRGMTRAITPTPETITRTKQSLDHDPRTPMQLSSPPGSPGRYAATNEKNMKQTRQENGYVGLTSSVVKGEAAKSLLDLKGVA